MIVGATLKGAKSDLRRAQIGRAKRARTRKELVTAAFHVFAGKGFDAPVVADFIAASGVSRGTFYNYFKTREEILAAVADELAAEINALILPVLSDLRDPAERVAASARCFIGMAAEDPVRGAILLRMIPIAGGPLNEQMRRHAVAMFSEGVSRGRFKIESIQAAHDIGLGMVAMVVRTILSKRHVPTNYTQITVAMYLRSLGIRAREATRIASMPLEIPGDTVDFVLSAIRRKQRRARQLTP
jgi:AcrR family transcriptional regulator